MKSTDPKPRVALYCVKLKQSFRLERVTFRSLQTWRRVQITSVTELFLSDSQRTPDF